MSLPGRPSLCSTLSLSGEECSSVQPDEDQLPWHSDLLNSSSPPSGQPTSPNSLDSLIALAHKRITTLVYLKKAYQGKVHWFNTILITPAHLINNLEPSRIRRRTTRFAILGMSLSALLDIITLQDFLRNMLTLLQEYESIPADQFKPKMVNLSRGIFSKPSSRGPRRSVTTSEYPISLQDSTDPSLLYSPNIPFVLDYFEVWITLSDILVEVYQKIISFISQQDLFPSSSSVPSSDPPHSTTASHQPGLSSHPFIAHHHHLHQQSSARPSPNLAHLTSVGSSAPLPTTTTSSAAPALPAVPLPPALNNNFSPPPSNLSQPTMDLINKLDNKLKKVVVLLTKEIDGVARSAIREELAALDPMLCPSGGTGGGGQSGTGGVNSQNRHHTSLSFSSTTAGLLDAWPAES